MNNPYDIIFQNALLEGNSDLTDLGIRNGRIDVIQPNLPTRARNICDVKGMMASPLFIDPHQHLDCAFFSEHVNQSGTLKEAIEINALYKESRSYSEVYDYACAALEQALYHGTGWIRSHVDIDSVSKLDLLHPVVEAREKYKGLVDVQIVAFPQHGLIRDPQSIALMKSALREGADIVGGMPHIEATTDDAIRHIDLLFEIAEAFDADIDMHVDESDDPRSRTLELLANATVRENYQGRVTAGHCCALAAYDDTYANLVIEKVAEAGIHVITNPMVNLYLQGRLDKHPKRRGITRVKELIQAGINVSCGQDDIKNIFFPFGRMDMLEVAMITALAAHLCASDEIDLAFDMPRFNAAKILRLAEYGIQPGAPANLVFLDAKNAQDALRLQPANRIVVREGKVIAESRIEYIRRTT